jgi:hypothetical protein
MAPDAPGRLLRVFQVTSTTKFKRADGEIRALFLCPGFRVSPAMKPQPCRRPSSGCRHLLPACGEKGPGARPCHKPLLPVITGRRSRQGDEGQSSNARQRTPRAQAECRCRAERLAPSSPQRGEGGRRAGSGGASKKSSNDVQAHVRPAASPSSPRIRSALLPAGEKRLVAPPALHPPSPRDHGEKVPAGG